MFVLTVAKLCSISSISTVAEAGVVWSVQGLACCKSVTRITNVREAAWVHQTGEPCCDTRHKSVEVYHESKSPNHFVILLLASVVPVKTHFILSLAALTCYSSTELIHWTTVHTGVEYSLWSNTVCCQWNKKIIRSIITLKWFTNLISSSAAAPSHGPNP